MGESAGNLIEIGHVNVSVPSQVDATDFYVTALGLTRDPYMMVGTGNMWVNAGRHQFHLPTEATAQCFRGTVGLVVPDLTALAARLTRGGYAHTAESDYIDVRSPWGNRIRAHAPHPRFGAFTLGIAYVEVDVPANTAAAAARFYAEVIGADASGASAPGTAHVNAGEQRLIFREATEPLPAYDGAHMQIYIADFAAPLRRLRERGLLTRESGAHEYRFIDIVSLDDGSPIVRLEHEVRSTENPLFGRPLVNRDPAIDPRTYGSGREAIDWAGSAS